MGRVEDLADKYERHISAPWQRNLAGAQKAIFIVYDKTDERKLRVKRREFEMRTREAGHKWREIDLTDSFPRWMARDEYRVAYFESPDDLSLKLQNEYVEFVASQLRETLLADDVDDDTVIGVFGAASLYGFTRISEVLKHVEGDIRGRLVLFFPGDHDQNNYRLMDARDGWNYLAVPITLNDGENR
ncbi:MAG: DUF1788 domain-containing protein [Planctomycetaceae bacterium]|nr:DUF1788 domain-containing protein [Planctomycetaceae bacterium]